MDGGGEGLDGRRGRGGTLLDVIVEEAGRVPFDPLGERHALVRAVVVLGTGGGERYGRGRDGRRRLRAILVAGPPNGEVPPLGLKVIPSHHANRSPPRPAPRTAHMPA